MGLRAMRNLPVLVGFLVPALLWYDHHSLVILITKIILGTLTGEAIRRIWVHTEKSDYKKTAIYSGLGLVLITCILLLAAFPFAQCESGFTDTAYDPIEGQCKVETFTCTSKFPWYYQECDKSIEEVCKESNSEDKPACQAIIAIQDAPTG